MLFRFHGVDALVDRCQLGFDGLAGGAWLDDLKARVADKPYHA
jgi:hypothetical protein